jgi:CRP-like cAMP-binding protein
MAGCDIELSTAGVPIDALIASMCRSARRVTLADRTALYAQSEPANTLFLILDGFVKTLRICEDGTFPVIREKTGTFAESFALTQKSARI